MFTPSESLSDRLPLAGRRGLTPAANSQPLRGYLGEGSLGRLNVAMARAIGLLVLALSAPMPALRTERVEMRRQRFPARMRLCTMPSVWRRRCAFGVGFGFGDTGGQYAVRLALSRRFCPFRSRPARGGTGENLWMGTRRRFRRSDDGRRLGLGKTDVQPGVFPAISRTGNWHQVGHTPNWCGPRRSASAARWRPIRAKIIWSAIIGRRECPWRPVARPPAARRTAAPQPFSSMPSPRPALRRSPRRNGNTLLTLARQQESSVWS